MNKKHPVIRCLLLAVLILLLWLLQSTPGLPALFGQRPFWLLAAALSVAACAAPAQAVVIGAICGVLADVSAGGGVGFFSVAFVLVCFALASVLGTYLNRNLATAAVLSAAAIVAVLGLYCLLFRVLAGASDGGALFVSAYLPRMLCTIIAFFPVYGIVWGIYRKT